MNNVKEMYETLVAIRESHEKCETGHDVLVVRTIDKALAEPPRNCDVGTPDEQSERFDAHCRRYMGCKACPLRDADGSVPKHCEFRWAQMPYEVEEGGAK